MFNLYIKQAAEIFGVTHTREIYEKAIEVLPDEQARWAIYYGSKMMWWNLAGEWSLLYLKPKLDFSTVNHMHLCVIYFSCNVE